ncbi:signal peptidase I [Streptomyces sp. NBC_01340]|uniref:signal peptidase I n=1 Tax=unclassified Streptomyces TaxID=2593676 RepID=UPI0022581423|nr:MULTISPECIES: signal peptidase I [unclassified Streptomyces]MCX4457107.1 signal peptidase I [Streptomyces sp. NBC_01719]MCX4496466.1 signal peptidase I [Streptomyces sp. NBC_01728]MCX4588949.1 signal peptidase I [Streptomyces sp. NBC_01549]MCX5093165.1 signal peptidase I [Streptomyces sp. NBC_00365]WSI41371.1 signal peptidase I [Streptomyces sp. NBC_01340]
MGDLAVGARSGHGGPEEQPERPDGSATPATNDVTGSGSDSGDGGGGTKEQGEQEPKPKKPRSFWKELPLLIGIALVLALLIKTFLVQAFSIPSDSMQNTLQQGDRVLVDKLTPWFGSEPSRGEVVVFHDPDNWLAGEPTPNPNAVQTFLSKIGLMPSANEKDLIKRVIGVAGDTIECKGNGPVKVNGKALNETSYVYAGNTPCSVDDQGGQFKVTVPKGKIWVMGDHRQNSLDSRYHQQDSHQGFVPVGNVVGRAIVIAWPPTRWDTLPIPDTFDQNLSAAAPGALGLAGAVPLVLWRRRRLTAGNPRVSGRGTAG